MEIQWGQIVTHMIGFLLAVWLLKRYAWGPLLAFVEKRREEIASSFEEIDRDKAEALALKDKYDKELDNIEEMRRSKIQQAAQEADKLAADIKEEARTEALAAREKAKQDIEIELDKANEVLKDRMVDAVITTTEKMINETLDKSKHLKLIEDVLKRAEANRKD